MKKPTIIRSIAVVAFCAAAATSALANEASYTCDGGTKLVAIFSPVGTVPGSVELLFAGEDGDTVLPQVLSADGGRYASAEAEFWIKGNSATLTRNGKSETCEVSPGTSN
jgi:membrane-bound inhibitor of C-type lysozyme